MKKIREGRESPRQNRGNTLQGAKLTGKHSSLTLNKVSLAPNDMASKKNIDVAGPLNGNGLNRPKTAVIKEFAGN